MIGVCVIGSGRAGMIHGRNFAGKLRGARLEALCDPNKEALNQAADELGVEKRYADLQQVLEDQAVDAVVVVTPTVFHRDIVIKAAQAGKHILCEKPMAMNEQECLDMIEACEENQVKLQIGFMRRFDESFRYAKKRIESGEIGEVVLVKSLTHGPSIPQPWMYDIKKSNGPLAEVSSHDIDALHWYSGSYLSEVYAVAGNYRSPDAVQEYPDFYDNVIMTARCLNGSQGLVDGAQGVLYGYDSRVEILGTKGIIHVGRSNQHSVVSVTQEGISTPFVSSWRTLFLDAYYEEDRCFIDAVVNDTPVEVTGLDGLEAVRVVNAGNRSITERCPIRIERERRTV